MGIVPKGHSIFGERGAQFGFGGSSDCDLVVVVLYRYWIRGLLPTSSSFWEL